MLPYQVSILRRYFSQEETAAILNMFDIPDPADCEEEVWSWDYFNHEQADGYWIRCTLAGQHDTHEDEHTGLRWPAEKKEIPMDTKKFARKPFYVDGVQVTDENMQQVSDWCNGQIKTSSPKTVDGVEMPGQKFIKVPVNGSNGSGPTMAFVGYWVLQSPSGFKVYTDKALGSNFDEIDKEQVQFLLDNPPIRLTV